MRTKLEWALELASKGFRVFPLAQNKKTPVIKNFSVRATTDADQIRAWWTTGDHLNIGIVTDDLLVVDVDTKDPKKNGIETMHSLNKQGFIFPPTAQQITTTEGLHLIYKTPHPVKNSASKLGPGLDIRGLGGYIVGAGSTIDGKEYRMDFRELAMAPKRVVDACEVAKFEKPQAHIKLTDINQETAEKLGKKYLDMLPTSTAGTRNDDAFKVAAKLKDIGCDRDIAFVLMMDDWKCEPELDTSELTHVVNSAYVYGKNPQGVESIEAMFSDETTPLPDETDLSPIQELNKEFAFVRMKGGHCILMETIDMHGKFTVDYLKEDTFHKMLAARQIQLGDGRVGALTKHWMSHAGRRNYSGIVFAPGEVVPKEFYNLWRGFSVEPMKPGEAITADMKRGVSLFEEHLFLNICGGNVDDYNWVYAWFAHIVQKPWEKPGTALVLKGRKGVGKNVLFDCIGSLFKNNFMVTANKKHLVGTFNSHLENKLLLVLDEALWGGNKEDEGILKDLVTGKTTQIEMKGYESYPVISRLRVAILGNEEWLVPASDDERRYAVFNVGEDRRQDTIFFTEMWDLIQAGANRYLLSKLLAFDLSKYNVRKAPFTKGLFEQKINSLSAVHEWWYNSLYTGTIQGVSEFGQPPWPTVTNLSTLLESAAAYIKNSRGKVSFLNERKMSNILSEVLRDFSIYREKDSGTLKVTVPDLKTCRRMWNEMRGMEIEWGGL